MFFEWMKETRLSEWIMKQEKKSIFPSTSIIKFTFQLKFMRYSFCIIQTVFWKLFFLSIQRLFKEMFIENHKISLE